MHFYSHFVLALFYVTRQYIVLCYVYKYEINYYYYAYYFFAIILPIFRLNQSQILSSVTTMELEIIQPFYEQVHWFWRMSILCVGITTWSVLRRGRYYDVVGITTTHLLFAVQVALNPWSAFELSLFTRIHIHWEGLLIVALPVESQL